MKKNRSESMEEETITNNSYTDINSTVEKYNTNNKIILFIAEYMSLSLKEKTTRYMKNKNIRSIKNPITSDTLIHYLCMNDDNYTLIELIKPNSFEKEQKNNLGQTLLHIATQKKSYKIMEYLLDNGSNINSKENKNNTPLHIAVKACDYNAIKILLKYKPKINIYNKNNETPYDIAKKMKNKEFINFLRKSNKEKSKFQISKIKNSIIDKNLKKYENLCDLKNIVNKSILNNISINNCSLDTKNETNNQSFNIYKKKIITNNSNIFLEDKIKNNRTMNLNTSINDNCISKIFPVSYLNSLSPKLETKFIYRKTSPKSIDDKYTLIEFDDDCENEFTPKQNHLSPRISSKINNISQLNFQSGASNNIFGNKNKNLYSNSNEQRLKNRYNVKCRTSKFIEPLILNVNENHNSKIKGVRKTVVNKSPFSCCKNNFKKDDLCKKKLFQFLKEIGMANYSKILISEGIDDIDLILKQMNEGFPVLEDTLKEIGIIPAGDRAKILIRLQEISNEFNFDFPFEEVYFKNNGSVKKWLDNEGLSKYNNNFLDAGYQSFELLLIQMASKFKINESILNNDLFILNDSDKKKILNSLEINSEKYVKELSKNHNIQRTYSKMVKKNSESICIII